MVATGEAQRNPWRRLRQRRPPRRGAEEPLVLYGFTSFLRPVRGYLSSSPVFHGLAPVAILLGPAGASARSADLVTHPSAAGAAFGCGTAISRL